MMLSFYWRCLSITGKMKAPIRTSFNCPFWPMSSHWMGNIEWTYNSTLTSKHWFNKYSSIFSYGQMISTSLIDFCRQYTQNLTEMHSSSWLSSLSNIVGNMFVSDEDCDRVQQIRANNALLLALYEAVHLNRNFITTLSHTHETSSPPSPSNTLNANQPVDQSTLASAPATPTALDVASQYPTNLLVAMFQYW